MNNIILLLIILLAGCAKHSHVQPTNTAIINKPSEALDFNQIKSIQDLNIKTHNTNEVLNNALNDARQKPQKFLNATVWYDFMPGAIYQIYTTPQKVTMISLEPGEFMVSAPQSGDTVRWQVNSIKSTMGENTSQHLIIKPLRDDLINNMIITSNKGRVYLLELISLKNSYMPEVRWNYPQNNIIMQEDSPQSLIPKKLNFNYKLINKQGTPLWRPLQVFDDGEKTFIQFPASIQQNELPSLFIKSSESKSQLVNYRYQENCFIVDRLFVAAELKLGLKKPDTIDIRRIK